MNSNNTKPDYVRAYELATGYETHTSPYFDGKYAIKVTGKSTMRNAYVPPLNFPEWEVAVLDGLERQRISVNFDFEVGYVYLGGISNSGSVVGIDFPPGNRAEALCMAVIERLGNNQ